MSPQSSDHNGSCPFALNCPTNQQSLFDVVKPRLRDTAALNTAISYYRRISGTVFSSPVDNHEMQKIKHETISRSLAVYFAHCLLSGANSHEVLNKSIESVMLSKQIKKQ